MSRRYLYIENPREHALQQIDPYGLRFNLGSDERSVLRECIDQSWDDGHARANMASLAIKTGISEDAARVALLELAKRGVIELQSSTIREFLVRPLLLASELGTQSGVGWWQCLELHDEL